VSGLGLVRVLSVGVRVLAGRARLAGGVEKQVGEVVGDVGRLKPDRPALSGLGWELGVRVAGVWVGLGLVQFGG